MSNQTEIEFSAPIVCEKLRNQELLIVNPRRKNGLIISKRYYAEFAGPGSVVGSLFDVDVKSVIPVGNLSLLTPQDSQERQRAYLIRRQWIRLTKQITDQPESLQRAKTVLEQFEHYFGQDTVAQIQDKDLAMLVGVLPQTVAKMRSVDEKFDF